MRKLLRRRPSPAMVVACLALIVALGGTSVAAVSQLVPRNSVGPRQIQFGAVTGPKIRANAVTSAKVANRSLLSADFARGQLPAGPTGPRGPAGPAGAAGAAGPAGPAGVIGAITVRTNATSIANATIANSFNTGRVQRSCEGNERAISAGTSWGDDADDLRLFTQEIEPVLNPQNQVVGFVAAGANGNTGSVGGGSSTFTVHVLCYTP